MEDDTIGFLYAVIVPNILTKSLKVTIDSAEQTLFYKRQDFLDLITKYGYIQIKPRLIDAFSKTQTILWKVKEDQVLPLSFKADPDSLLADLLNVKYESQHKVEDLPLVEKFSRTEIDISDPEHPIFKLF